MGELSLASAPPAEARACHEQAHAIATEIASPLEEARAQEGIGRCHLQDGQANEGAASLRQALAIYQHIGSPAPGGYGGRYVTMAFDRTTTKPAQPGSRVPRRYK